MANKLSNLGGSIYVDGYDGERIVTLLADGTAKAGSLVGQTAGAGSMREYNPTGNLDEFDGILEERYDTDIDTAPTSGKACRVVHPKAGHRYRIKIKDPTTILYPGEPMGWVDGTPGALDKTGNIETGLHVAYITKQVADGDTYAEVRWGA